MANTYLQRTVGTPTNSQKYTYSFWIKRCELSDGSKEAFLLDAYADGSNRAKIAFQSGDQLEIWNSHSGSDTFALNPPRKFRDTSNFYHIVLSVDTTQSTASDRVKLYVNGVQETSLGSTTYPSVNDANNTINESGTTFSIMAYGANASSDSYRLSCIMSHIHFIDGTQYQASDFGSFDSTTGEWKINTSPSVTYGNNGFFILKDGNSVTDQSGNSNNFTVGGGTLTNTEDCPSNVFATGNPLYFTNSAWTTSLSNGNNTMTGHTGTNSYPILASTLAASSGKFYAEFKVTSSSQNYYVGVATPEAVSGTAINAHYPNWNNEGGSNANAYSIYGADGFKYVKENGGSTSSSSYASTTSQNDIIGIALDLDNNKLYFHKNGTYFNSGVPTSGSTGTGAISVINHDYLFFFSDGGGSTDASATANFGNGFFGTTAITTNSGNGYAGAEGSSKFNYQPPTGYSALSTKGLNQ